MTTKRDDFFVIVGSCCTLMGILVGSNKILKYVLLSMGVILSAAGIVIMMKEKKMKQ